MKSFNNYGLIIVTLGITFCKENIKQSTLENPRQELDKSSSSQVANSRQSIELEATTLLPYSFGMIIFDSLTKKSEYEKQFFEIANGNFEEHSGLLKQLKIDDISFEGIHKITKSFAPLYYAILLHDESKFSHPHLLEVLPPINDSINVLVFFSKISKVNSPLIIGGIMEIVTFSTNNKSIIGKKPILVAGIGKNDEFYYECFSIDKEYNVKMKSYLNLEDESTIIRRNLRINKDGKIEDVDAKVSVKDRLIEESVPILD